MLTALIACILLIVLTTVVHYEVLTSLNARLPAIRIPARNKVLLVICVAFVAHAVEIVIYAAAWWLLMAQLGIGTLVGDHEVTLASCLFLSAETYTSIGFGDFTPIGPVRLLAGVEALNGLLLIAWTASFTYLAMERFWVTKPHHARHD